MVFHTWYFPLLKPFGDGIELPFLEHQPLTYFSTSTDCLVCTATLTGTWIGALFWESIRPIERGAALERCIFRAGGDGGAASAVWLIRAAPAVEPLSCSCASAIISSRIYSSPGVCLLSLSVTYTLPQLSGSLQGYWRSPSVYRTLVYWAEVRYPS